MPLGLPIILKLGWQSLGAGVGYIVLSAPEPVFVVVRGVVDLVRIELKESFAVDLVVEVGSSFEFDSFATIGSEGTLVAGFSSKLVDSEELFFSLQALMVTSQRIPNKAITSN